jgi:hypothetical protein
LASLASIALVLAVGLFSETEAYGGGTNPAGTWTWAVGRAMANTKRAVTMTLKVNGDKVTGEISIPRQQGGTIEEEIENGKLTGDEISFSTSQEATGTNNTKYKMITQYRGKITADTIKGKKEYNVDGHQVREGWNAHRAE